MPARIRLAFDALEEACFFVSSGGVMDATAYVFRRTGEIHLHAPEVDLDEVPEEDLDDPALFAVVPDKTDLDLGLTIVRDFTAEELPDLLERINAIFRSRGAFRRFKDLLIRAGKLERWYDYEAERMERALREWCEQEGFEPRRSSPDRRG